MLRTSADVVQFVLGQQARDVEGLGEYPDLVQRIMHVLGVVVSCCCNKGNLLTRNTVILILKTKV